MQPFGYTGYRYDNVANTYFAQAREYVPGMGRFAGEDWIKGSILSSINLNQYIYCISNPIKYIDLNGKECIAVSGGIYSAEEQRIGEYYYEFLDVTIAQIHEWKKSGKNNITWIVADAGWTSYDKDSIKNIANDEGVELVYIKNKGEFINYLNTRKKPYIPPIANPSNATKRQITRKEDLISDVSIFSHGLGKEGEIVSLGYNYDSEYDVSLNLTISDIYSINMEAFNTPLTNFYSCNTGTDKKSSFAQKWVNRVGGITYAFAGTTTYTGVTDLGYLQKLKRFFKINSGLGGDTKMPGASENVEKIIFTPNCAE